MQVDRLDPFDTHDVFPMLEIKHLWGIDLDIRYSSQYSLLTHLKLFEMDSRTLNFSNAHITSPRNIYPYPVAWLECSKRVHIPVTSSRAYKAIILRIRPSSVESLSKRHVILTVLLSCDSTASRRIGGKRDWLP